MQSNKYTGIEKCCFTGYRPAKFPFSLDKESEEYKKFENVLIEEILRLIESGCNVFYSGMAMGFDIIAAELILMIKKSYDKKQIKLICVLPFKLQSTTFPSVWKERFQNVLKNCQEKIVLSDEYFPGCYQKRNKFMVDKSDAVLTWYNGSPGGTKNTIDYAISRKKFILNTYNNKVENFAMQTYMIMS